jgi:inner membrane transporter RhtA
MVWLRLATSTVVLVVIARPRLRGRTRADWLVVLGFGTALLTMNWAIYQSFARMPLGLAVTIEFLGPLTIALVGSRRRLDLLWVALAAVGVAMLGLDTTGVTVSGVAFALLAGACWAAYIPLSAATGRRWPGFSGLALASVVGAVVLAPYALTAGGADNPLLDPRVLAVGVLVGLLSSVVPYSLELAALRTMPSHVFGILMSLEPAAAALAGVVLLSELLGPVQWLAVACVVAASVGVTRSLTATVDPPPVLT